eukprot:TRINITY_DN463_c0_g1_i9.p1 TRINITY_DN463_c0_g1~~TRINITY_DN463_c0_g1_i9.p1  ORF type:complete len:220 (-),score=17.90 TRINITY_DN463_c0_g1_i9:469-1128(-)
MLFLGNNTSSHAHYLFPLTLVCFHLYLLRLDDLREFRSKIPIPVYLDKETYQDLSRVFPYLVDVSKATSSGFVSSLAWNIIDTGTPFVVFGLRFTPLPVKHGPITCLGYSFGDVVYLSDVSEIPSETGAIIRRLTYEMPHHQLGTLVIDALSLDVRVSSHLTLQQAVEEIRNFNPRKAYLIGMSHMLEHSSTNFFLRKEGNGIFDAECSYDGLSFTFST